MNINKFTIKSREALESGQKEALNRGHQEVDVPHLGMALINQSDTAVTETLRLLGYDHSVLREILEKKLSKIPSVSGSGYDPAKIGVSQKLATVLIKADDEAKKLKDELISVEHLFLSILLD
ncbi:MAG: type VI secretion system ATPase TssH, partial [Deltaproteobacteria bacterium]|nr:type VI secretion system ATPase TssH [Deltaproteobacteria bacterium]